MLEFWQVFFASGSFIPPENCYLWPPNLLWLNICSNSLNFFTCYVVFIILIYFAQKQQDLPFKELFLLFGIFSLSYGINDLIEIWMLWHPVQVHWISSLLKAVITGITACTAVYLASNRHLPLIVDLNNREEIVGKTVYNLPCTKQQEERQPLLTAIDANGVPYAVCGISTDITERKATEEALLHISKAIESTSDAIAITDRTGKSIYHNPAFVNLFEYTVEELNVVGGPRGIYTDPTAAHNVFTSLIRGSYWNGEVELRSKSDRILQVSLRADAIRDQTGQIIGLIGIHTDITQRKQAQEALRQSEAQLRQKATLLEQALHELQQTQAKLVQSEKMSSLGQLVAGVAHEINNPLNFIHGNLTYLSHYVEDLLNLVQLYQEYYPHPAPEIQVEAETIDLDLIKQDLPKVVSSMRVGVERICQIIVSLQNFSKAEQTNKKQVDIHESLDNTLRILASRLQGKPGCPAIQVIKEYGNLPKVLCYPEQLNQVFINLLTNAIDAFEMEIEYLPRGLSNNWKPLNHQSAMPIIRIRTEVLDSNQVMIRISDNGAGMTEEIQKRVFDPFFTTKPVGYGRGLGLSISYQIVVEKHGGQLQCLSALGQGAEFLIFLPK